MMFCWKTNLEKVHFKVIQWILCYDTDQLWVYGFTVCSSMHIHIDDCVLYHNVLGEKVKCGHLKGIEKTSVLKNWGIVTLGPEEICNMTLVYRLRWCYFSFVFLCMLGVTTHACISDFELVCENHLVQSCLYIVPDAQSLSCKNVQKF